VLAHARDRWLAAALVAFGPATARTAPEDAASVRTVEVTARRFGFDPPVIEVTRGQRVRLVLRSEDVTHGMEIKDYDVDVQIPKGGEAVAVEFVADRSGRFRVICSQYCGSGHRRMRAVLVVVDAPEISP